MFTVSKALIIPAPKSCLSLEVVSQRERVITIYEGQLVVDTSQMSHNLYHNPVLNIISVVQMRKQKLGRGKQLD